MLFIFLLSSQTLYAQEPEINIQFSSTPIGEVLQTLEKQSRYSFSYESSLLNQFKPVTLEVKHSSLENILKMIFNESDIEYKIKGTHQRWTLSPS